MQKGAPQMVVWYSHRPLMHLYRSLGVDCPSGQLQVSPPMILIVPSVQQGAQ